MPLGTRFNDVVCQDVQKLTYPDEHFDVCTSLEVFEHVADDMTGFGEIYRVLKPGGFILFSVPLSNQNLTIERTGVIDGERQNILPPEYHSDSLRGADKVFCFRNYGSDILQRLASSGFENTEIRYPDDVNFGYGRPMIFGRKPIS